MHRWHKRRQKFRAQLQRDDCSFPASVYDPVSVRIVENLGFEVGIFGGSIASLTVLGAPDIILLTLSELTDQAMRISRASDLPVLVDADHGYGNALNTMRCVEELEAAGVAGLSVEDTELPAVTAGGEPRLISLAEGVGKMKAALSARADPDLVIAARTSAAIITDARDAATRMQAYEQAGVDALFLYGVKDLPGLETIARATTLPLILGNAPRSLKEPGVLAANRVKICLRGHQPFAAATQAIYDTLRRLKAGEDPAKLPNLASVSLMETVSRTGDYKRWAGQFLDADG